MITPIQQRYLTEGFARFGYLTPELLLRLFRYSPNTSKYVLKHLIALRQEYLSYTQIPTKFPKTPHVYTLNAKGQSYLRKEYEIEPLIVYKQSELELLSTNALWHPLELNKFLIEAVRLEHFVSLRPHLDFDPRIGEMTLQELPALFLNRLDHDLLLQRTGFLTVDREGIVLESNPDGILEFRIRLPHKSQKHRRFFWIEYERTRKNDEVIAKKIRSFLLLRDHGVLSKQYGDAWDFNWCFLTSLSPDYLENVRAIAKETIASLYTQHEYQEDAGRVRAKKGTYLYFATVPPLLDSFVDPLLLFTQPYWLHALGDKETRYPLIHLDSYL